MESGHGRGTHTPAHIQTQAHTCTHVCTRPHTPLTGGQCSPQAQPAYGLSETVASPPWGSASGGWLVFSLRDQACGPPRGAQGPVVGAAFPTCTGRGAKEQMHSRRAVTMQGEDNHRAVLCPWGGHVHCPITSLETSWLPPEQPHCERLRPRLLGTWQVRERPPCRCHMGSLVGWGPWRMRVMGLGVTVLFPHSAMF